eukprot:9133873-Karenia_brevis.AAC.1
MACDREAASHAMGLEAYMKDYGNDPKTRLQNRREEFMDWTVIVPFDVDRWGVDGDLELLCCPEDLRCASRHNHKTSSHVCAQCEVPICRDCKRELSDERPWTAELEREPPTRAL